MHTSTQSGYKKFHSCETAVMKIVNDTQSEILKKNCVVLLMLDLSAAFDTIDQCLLIEILKKTYGLDGRVILWIESYLKERTFGVIINGSESKKHKLLHGVPQGSILGPLFFIMYVSGLSTVAENCGMQIHIYADDTNLYLGFAPGSSFSVAGQSIARCLREVELFMLKFFLKLNVSKTQLLICGQKNTLELFSPRFVELEASLNLTGCRVQQGKTLGTVIDQNLKFDDMMNQVCSSGFYQLNKLKNLRTTLEVEDKLTLVKSLILSRIDYCSFLYCACKQKQIKKLQKLLNASIRFIFDLRRSASVSSYMAKCHILPVRWRIKYKLCYYVFKIIRGEAPKYLSELFHRQIPNRMNLRSESDKTQFTTEYEEGTIARSMCEVWNKLPRDVRDLKEIDIFKRKLKTFYYREAFM